MCAEPPNRVQRPALSQGGCMFVEAKHPAGGLEMPADPSRKPPSSAFLPFAHVRGELAKCSRGKCSPPPLPAENIRMTPPLPPHGAPAPRLAIILAIGS